MKSYLKAYSFFEMKILASVYKKLMEKAIMM